jgi:hypothetical protein
MPTQMRKEMPETNSNYESAFRRAGPALDLVLDPQFNQISMVFLLWVFEGQRMGCTVITVFSRSKTMASIVTIHCKNTKQHTFV